MDDNRQQQQDQNRDRQFGSSGPDDRQDNLDIDRGESQGGGGFGAQQQQDEGDSRGGQNANLSEEGDRNGVNRGNDQSR